jgi:hypothetical protein
LLYWQLVLALHLGKTLKEIEKLVDTDELVLWAAFNDIHPFDIPPDLLAAQVCWTFASVMGAKPKPRFDKFLMFRNREKQAGDMRGFLLGKKHEQEAKHGG